MNVREIALKLLLDVEESGKYVNLSLLSHLTDSLSREERGVLTALLYTTVEHKLTYDYVIAAYTARPTEKLSAHTLAILRLGLCQLLHMKKMPDFAAVNESVRLAKNKGEAGLVNAVLRRAAKERDSLPMPKWEKNAPRYYSVYYSVPLPTVRHLIDELGEMGCVSFLESLSTDETALTVNLLKTTRDALVERLTLEGYEVYPSSISPVSIKVKGSFDPRSSAAFRDGEFLVQDEASVLPALVLSPTAGKLVIDTCSAPGGKSMALAILSGDGADVRSFDLHESKLSLISSSADRLGLKSVRAEVRDATSPDRSLFGKADLVLCDVPCSGLGVLRKKPDLRYKDLSSLAELPALQLKILTESAKYLKPGGLIVYSTCTLSKKENEGVVEKFLSESSDFVREDFSVLDLSSTDGMLTLYPHVHNTDGFFIAAMRKK
ncbi:MAG: 16S rRNA (cytosine(967)-C(5))-methyltransferase RsmB [Clostridia bacterium]|nr:16S rRNA (cytosine(967)-C(5))-methyltransferase RsmB [Clostridia bacterium]